VKQGWKGRYCVWAHFPLFLRAALRENALASGFMITHGQDGRMSGAPRPGRGPLPLLAALLAAGLSLGIAWSAAGAEGEPDATTMSARQLYNDGTQKLRAGKLREAETSLQSAVASQDERVQEASLYNLGHARFRQGEETLKKGPNAQSTHAAAFKRAFESGGSAIRGADEALAGDDLQSIVAAYLRGRGARKDLKAANKAVKEAMDLFGGVLAKWRRARGDFKSAHELRRSDTDAETNADVVDRNIAKLVDLQQMMMQMMAAMGEQRKELREKMEALKKRMPKDMGDQLSGKDGEDDDEDEGKKGKQSEEPKPGEREPESKDGKPRMLTQEEAQRLLGMLKLDNDRKLPMGLGDTSEQPKDRKGRDW